MRKLIPIIALLILASCGKSEPEPNQIRFAKVNSLPIIEVTINGKNARLLVDTGASQSLLDVTASQRYGFNAFEVDDEFHGIGGVSTVFEVNKATVRYRDSLLNANFKAADLGHLRRSYGISGIVGSDWLRKRAAQINYSNNMITLMP